MTTVTTALVELPRLLPLQRILVIEKDNAMQTKLQQLFESEGYGVEIAGGWTEAQNPMHNVPASVLVLDLQTADANPRRLFEEMQFANPGVPIVVLGPPSGVADRVLFLELGADDYVVKPFNGRELVARLRVAMRRSKRHSSDIFTFGEVQVDFHRMEVRRQGALVALTAQQFKVLKFMIQHPERALSRDELLNAVWGYHNYPTTRTVDNHILKLRQKLELQPSDPIHFITLHCVGYKFVPHPSGRSSAQ